MKKLSAKKFGYLTLATALLGLSSSLVATPNANAAIGVISLIGGPGGIIVIEAGAAVLIGGSAGVAGTCAAGAHFAGWSDDCNIWLNVPFWGGLVILDKQVTSIPPVKRSDLIDSGFTQERADNLMLEFKKHNEQMAHDKTAFSLTSHETLRSIQDGIRKQFPDASKDYVDVYSRRLLLVSQTKANHELDSRNSTLTQKAQSLEGVATSDAATHTHTTGDGQ